MRRILKLTLAVVMIGFGAATSAIAVSDPKGDGPPDSKSCRRGPPITGSSLPGPSVCLTNAQWVALHAKNKTISADGKSVVSFNGTSYYDIKDQFMGDDRDMVSRGQVISGSP